MKGPAVEIRAKVDGDDLWEIVSSHRCCGFAWQRDDSGRGVVSIDDRAHEECKREVADYARRRAYRIEWKTASATESKRTRR